MDSDLERSLRSYLEHERVAQNREYVKNLAKYPYKEDELRRLLCRRLLFGTAGIRGPMGPGYGQMNELVVIQTSQGLASYLLEHFGASECSSRGLIIGHDARHNSGRFARLAAAAFMQRNMKVKFSEKIAPTPVIAFGVTNYGCLAGVVVTASHNPKNDNGYKVYWSNGAQILSPHDKNIQRHIEMKSNLRPWPEAWACEQLEAKYPKLFECVHDELAAKYYKLIENQIREKDLASQEAKQLRITYTAMHGVGHEFLTRALEMANFKHIFPVEQQRQPDANFPTVEFPNPEESGALDLAFETAKLSESTVILANDPDADRCAVAIYEAKTRRQRTLTGNELGALLGWWLWHRRKNSTKSADKFYMLSTAVSSRFLQSMAKVEGFQFVETLTGFKYMGNEAEQILRSAPSNNEVLFAYEEAIGYMIGADIFDKDGIAAAVQVALCAEYLHSQFGRTLGDQLDWLYSKYGYHYCLNSYYLCYEPQTIRKIFSELQKNLLNGFGPQFRTTRVRDLNLGLDSETTDRKPRLPTSSSSFMVTFWVNDGEIVFTIRTSGTEPKIKYYSEIITKQAEEGQQEALRQSARDKLHQFVREAIERCLAPSEHNLKPAASG